MAKFLAAAWEQIYGLLVEDGQIAVGTLAAFIACGAVSAAAVSLGNPTLQASLRNSAGPLLFVLLMSLLLVNLYTTGRKAFAKRTRA
ncbi:MAG: hypothetical protein ACR2IK_24715 [Chloroflexota bacterium]